MKTAHVNHPNHQITDQIASAFLEIQSQEEVANSRRDEIARLARPTESELNLKMGLKGTAGLSAEVVQKLRDARNERTASLRDAVLSQTATLHHVFPWDSSPPPPEPNDPTFWWARTDAYGSKRNAHITPGSASGSGSNFDFAFASEGLKFFGSVYTHDGKLYFDRFGATALFELTSDRIPHSRSGLWRSTPYVELTGGLFGYTGDSGIFTGDLWSKCWMYRKQEIYQFGFAASVSTLGAAEEIEQLVFEENEERSVNPRMRGFQWMPPVTFGRVDPNASLWSRLEIRFDVQTEGAGTILALDPIILLRTFQWQLTPL